MIKSARMFNMNNHSSDNEIRRSYIVIHFLG